MRTAAHPSINALTEAGIAFETFDALYERCRTYETLYRAIVREVRAAGKTQRVCYCVDGAPAEDRAARTLMKYKNVAVVDGVSKASAAAAKAGIANFFTLSAYDVAESKIALPLVIYDFAKRDLASDVKLLLAERLGDEAPAYFVCGDKIKKIALYEADRQPVYDATCALVLPEQELTSKHRFDFEDFVAILRRLRAPDGCPWDRAQTHESIRINCLEEAYELVDAIDADDADKICEESGDVLMQAAFHALIEEERGRFTVTDMLSQVCDKLITRHTHVFGKDAATGADGALTVWEKNKMKEKHQETFSDAVNDVPECFPALLRAQKIVKRMAKGGWQFDQFEKVAQKLGEELGELRAAYEQGDERGISEEMGDVLILIAQMGRLTGVDCEQSLLDAVKKVQKRYTAFESLVLADGKDVNALSEEEWFAYYKRAKDGAQS